MIKNTKQTLSHKKHLSDLVNSSIISFGLRIVGIGMGFLFIWLISRNLGAAGVGVFTLAFTVLQIVSVFGRFGLDTALLRFVAVSASLGKLGEAAGTYAKAVRFAFVLALILSLLTYMLSPILANKVFGNSQLVTPFQISAIGIIPLTLTCLNFETLRAVKLIRDYAFFQNVSTYFLATLALFLLSSLKMTANVVMSIFVCSVWGTWVLSQYRVNSFFKRYVRSYKCTLSSVLKTALPMLVASSLMLIMGWTDTIMIGIFIDESSVGIYSVALKISMVTSIMLSAINSMAAPKFAEFYAKSEMLLLQQAVTYTSRMIFWTSLPILLISVSFPELILGVFGEDFKIAAWVLIVLCLGQFINVLSGSVAYLLQMTGNEKIFQYIISVSILINVILNFWLIPLYEMEGAALASAISLSFWNICSVIYCRRVIKVNTLYVPEFVNKGKMNG